MPTEGVSPKLQAANDPARTCGDCRHLLRHGTCGEPVAAGLAPWFGIVWPPGGHGAHCAGFDAQARRAAQDRPYRLTPEQGDRCHAGGWDDAEIATFTARHARLLRRGYGNDDAEDLAERLTLRDRDADNRVICTECQHYRSGRCGNHRAAGLQAPEMGPDLAAMLQRCAGFTGTAIP
ncbi:MAG: hypothetical protein H0W48_09065 [Methylibium sp.]|nr:hypothetical protein [Methylibium sp.]